MKYGDFMAELSAAGCFLLRHGAKHDIWHSPITGKHFAMPRHCTAKEVPIGTERKIRNESGVK